MPNNLKVVLFEDSADVQSELLNALRQHLKPDGVVIPFEGSSEKESDEEKNRMYEDRLEKILAKSQYSGATLFIADRDLSKSANLDFGGLSVGAVATASKRLAIPICSYARQAEPADYEWRSRWEEGHITLQFSEGTDELARQAALAARGFALIAEKLPQVLKSKASSLAKILASLLDKPEYAEKIALYAVGDQNRLSEFSPKAKQKEMQQMTRFLGYWLWDSLLRYPGVFVNEVAAESYLNIEIGAFHESDVQKIFADAFYHGPFEDPKRPQWWRGVLDDIVSSNDCSDGLQLVQKKVSGKIGRSKCCEDSSKQAGYYCIISRQPVSLENSKGGLSWFPRGADLTRISKSKFEEYGPWLGL